MDSWKLVLIIIGVLGALVGVYFREALRHAIRQRNIAIRLEAYLLDWNRYLLKGAFKSFYLIGYTWEEKLSKAFRQSGREGFLKAREEIDGEIEDLKEFIKSGKEGVRESVETQFRQIKKLKKETYQALLRDLEFQRTVLVEDKLFISDEDAALVSWFAAQHVIPIKSHLFLFLQHSKQLILTCRDMDEFNYSDITDSLTEIILSGINFSRKYMPLLKHIQLIRHKSLIDLVIRNMIGKT